jgi:hypothetical protein
VPLILDARDEDAAAAEQIEKALGLWPIPARAS